MHYVVGIVELIGQNMMLLICYLDYIVLDHLIEIGRVKENIGGGDMKKLLLIWAILIISVTGGYWGGMVVKVEPPIQSAVKVVEDNIQSVVYLEIYMSGPLGGIYLAASASGVIIDEDGLVATAGHVTRDVAQIRVYLQDGREFIVDDLDYYSKGDLGLIQIPKVRNLRAVELGDYDNVKVGEQVIVIGSPLGIRCITTVGVVSHTKQESPFFGECPMLRLDAAAYPGNSGGPIFNANGELIGILVGGIQDTECLNLGMTVQSLKDYLYEYRGNKL